MALDSDQLDQIEAAKSASVAQLLFKCARLLNDIGIERLREQTGRPIRTSHTQLFPHIDFAGTRLTELAKRVGTSKQAVGVLVSELEAMGTVERVPDPKDGRAKLIRFSAQGREGILRGLDMLRAIEAELAQEVGEASMRGLHDVLTRLLPVLEDKHHK